MRVGAGFSQTRDEVLSPLSYRGVQLTAGAAFAHDQGQNRHQAQLEFLPAYKVDRFGYRGVFFTQRFDYRYLRTPSGALSAAWRIAVGAGAGVVLDPALYTDASTDYPYWQTIYDLRTTARLEHALSQTQALELDAALSVLGMGSRPPIERFDVGEFGFSGTRTLTRAPFTPPQHEGETIDPTLAQRIEEVRALARQARDATTYDERGRVYGELLARCATCHYLARPAR